jgi:lambda family phage portal protein
MALWGGGTARAYDAASTGRRTQNWLATNLSADAEVLKALSKLRARSRDMVRNDPHAGRVVDIWTANVVGCGIVPRFRTGAQDLDRKALDLWQAWAEQCDAEGRTNFDGLTALMVRSMVEAGEALCRRRNRQLGDGLAVPLQLQLLEPDYLDTSRDSVTAQGGQTIGGIVFDALGRRSGYHLFRSHPGGFGARAAANSTLVPAADIVHLLRQERIGQNHGVPWLARSLLRLRELQEWDEAALVKAKTEACIALVVTRSGAGSTPLAPASTDPNNPNRRIETLEPGMVAYTQPGEEVTTVQPSGSSSYEPFALHHLQAAAVGAGLTHDQLTGDLRQANYSSLRAGKIEQRRLVEQIQWHCVIPQWCQPVMRWWLDQAVTAGQLPAASYRVDWVPPRHEPIDPAKDIKADVTAIAAGLEPQQEVIARYGYDWRDLIAQAAEFQAEAAKAGLKFDSSPAPEPAPMVAEDQPQP